MGRGSRRSCLAVDLPWLPGGHDCGGVRGAMGTVEAEVSRSSRVKWSELRLGRWAGVAGCFEDARESAFRSLRKEAGS